MKRILVIGDAWGLCYRYDDQLNVDCLVQDNLASLLNQFEGNDCYNYCRQNLSNLKLLNEFKDVKVHPNDIIVVIQSDPIKDIINNLPIHQNKFIGKVYIGPNKQEHNVHEGLPAWVPYKPRWSVASNYTSHPPLYEDIDYSLLENAIEQLLDRFYSQLDQFQKHHNCKIILHGGSCKINAHLAHKHNLLFTIETSSEILLNNFVDGYFSSYTLLEHALIKLKHHYPQFNIMNRADIFSTLQKKRNLWQSEQNKDFFTGINLTVLGQQKIAEYLNNLL